MAVRQSSPVTRAVGGFMRAPRGPHTPTHGPGNPAWEELHAKEMAQRQLDGNPQGLPAGQVPPMPGPLTGLKQFPGDQMAPPPAAAPVPGLPQNVQPYDPSQGIDNLMPISSQPAHAIPLGGSQPNQPAPAPPGPWAGSQPMQPAKTPVAPHQSPAMLFGLWNAKHSGETLAQNKASFAKIKQPRAIPGGAAPNAMSQPPPAAQQAKVNTIMPNMQTGR